MHIHSLALFATACLLSITGHAAPLSIKRENQQQGGTVTDIATKATGLKQGLVPVLDPINGAIIGFYAAKSGAEGVIPLGDKGLTADTQAIGVVTGLATSVDNATGSGGKKQN
ncbi:hypothetical protein K492DRAFT_193743 [Lichtheimia hyalospora FSU 10163]|nr:hypothetical protein K492DRAFT_193743 [Lichtheimia hyalospora FSU 10163]